MSLKDLTDKQVKELLKNPDAFIKKKKNTETLIGFDSTTKRKFADIMKYEMRLSDEQIKQKLDEVAAIKLREIDVFN